MTVVPLPSARGDWIALMRAAVNTSSLSAVADRIGVSRTTVSLVLAGRYPARTHEVERKVRDAFESRWCPPLTAEIEGSVCQRYRTRPMPRSSARDLRHWRACQTCIHNPDAQENSHA